MLAFCEALEACGVLHLSRVLVGEPLLAELQAAYRFQISDRIQYTLQSHLLLNGFGLPQLRIGCSDYLNYFA